MKGLNSDIKSLIIYFCKYLLLKKMFLLMQKKKN